MLEIKTGVVVGLEVDGLEFPLEHGGFQHITIVSNKRMSVTTCEIQLSDMSKAFDNKITLADGTPLVLKVGRTLSEFETYHFRVFKFVKLAHGGVSQYTIIGYWNSPAWFLNSVKTPIRASSSAAIEQLAQACDLEVDVDPTNDEMIWLPKNARTCAFARAICEHGYLDDQSYMVMGMTLQGQIRYWNLNLTAADQSTIPRFVHADTGRPNTYMVYDHKNLGASGFGNAMGGYRHLVREQSVVIPVRQIDALNVKRQSQRLLVNRDIRSGMDTGRIEIAPVDCGNVHLHWNQAKYQNQRNSMIYSLGVELLLRQPTIDLDLFDEFFYQAAEPPGPATVEVNESYMGLYVVTAKAIHVDCGNYFEKVQGYTTGLNSDPGGFGDQE